MGRILSLGGAILAASTLVAACSSGADSGPAAGGAGEASSDDAVFRTAVRVHADGTRTVTTSFVTRAQAEADAAARAHEREALVSGAHLVTADYTAPPDPSCVGADIWLYDGDGTGGVCPPPHRNEICFAFDANATNGARDATYDFASYARCMLSICIPGAGCGCTSWGNWKDSVGAYWPGVSAGFIEGLQSTPPYDTFSNFNAWGACTTAVQAPQPLHNAIFLALAPPG
jgi:hypothetical protein